MLITLALAALAASPSHSTASAAPAAPVRVEHAGFVRDARALVTPDQHLLFEARVEWPVSFARRSFAVEGHAADGSLLFSRKVTAEVATASARRKRAQPTRFRLDLPALDGVSELVVRPAP